jgi:hypothetical protein
MYLTTRESFGGDLTSMKIAIFGPVGLTKALKNAWSFIGTLNYIKPVEWIASKE